MGMIGNDAITNSSVILIQVYFTKLKSMILHAQNECYCECTRPVRLMPDCQYIDCPSSTDGKRLTLNYRYFGKLELTFYFIQNLLTD